MMMVVRPFITSAQSVTDPGPSVVASTEAGRVVEDQDARVDEQRPRDRDPLALSSRECDSRSPTTVSYPCGSSRMKSCACAACAAAYRLVRRVRHPEGDVVANRRGEEERILRDDPDLPDRREVANVDPVDEHLPGRRAS